MFLLVVASALERVVVDVFFDKEREIIGKE